MVCNDISVILNLACIKATGQPLPADGEEATQWFYRTNYINCVPEMIGKRYAFMKNQPKPTLDYLPPIYRPSTLNDFGLQVKRSLVVSEIQHRFGMKSKIQYELNLVYETLGYYEVYCRNINNAHGVICSDDADPERNTELPWNKQMVRMIITNEQFDDYHQCCDYHTHSLCDNRDLEWLVSNYWEKIRPKIMYILWDIESNYYLPLDDELSMYIRRFQRVDKKIMEFRKEMRNPTYPVKYSIHEAMRDNIEGRMWGKTALSLTEDLLKICPRVNSWCCDFLTQCGQLKKNKKLQTQYIDAYNKINAILPDIQASYITNYRRLHLFEHGFANSFIPTNHKIKDRLNEDVVSNWLKQGELDQDSVLRIYIGKRKSSEEVIMNLDLESSYAIRRRS